MLLLAGRDDAVLVDVNLAGVPQLQKELLSVLVIPLHLVELRKLLLRLGRAIEMALAA